MDKLPDVLVAAIVSYFDLWPRITTLPLVSKRFKHCASSPLAWSAIDVSTILRDSSRPLRYLSGERATELLTKICDVFSPQSVTECLRIRIMFDEEQDDEYGTIPPQFYPLLASFTSVCHLKLDIDATDISLGEPFIAAIGAMRHLSRLSLQLSCSLGFSHLPLHAWSHLNHLKLSIRGFCDTSQPGNTLAIPPSLISLQIKNLWTDVFDLIDFSSATNLQSLNISSSNPKIAGTGLRGLSRLETMSIADCKFSNLTESDMQSLTRLKVVHLVQRRGGADYVAFTDKLAFIPHSVIEYISMNGCDISPQGMDAIGKLPLLEQLVMYKCKVTTAPAFAPLASSRSLRCLNITYDGCVGGDFFQAICQMPTLTNLDLSMRTAVYDREQAIDQGSDNGDYERNKEYADLLGQCTNLRSLRYSTRFARTTKIKEVPYTSLTEIEADAIGRLHGLQTLSVAMPRSCRALSSLISLQQLVTLEFRFDDWDAATESPSAWFKCLLSLSRLQTLIFSFRAWVDAASPLLLIGMAPFLRDVRDLAHVHVRVYASEWHFDVTGDAVRDAVIDECHEVAGVFAAACCQRAIKLTVCGKTYDLNEIGAWPVKSTRDRDWRRKEEEELERKSRRCIAPNAGPVEWLV